ncbi:MAG: hypothetical protein ACJASH_002374 [Bermanella sp.]|jgi:hypothetical protein
MTGGNTQAVANSIKNPSTKLTNQLIYNALFKYIQYSTFMSQYGLQVIVSFNPDCSYDCHNSARSRDFFKLSFLGFLSSLE